MLLISFKKISHPASINALKQGTVIKFNLLITALCDLREANLFTKIP